MHWLIPFLYTTGLVLVTAYAVGQLHLLLILAVSRRSRPCERPRLDRSDPLPRVTVQLPIYNEPRVASAAIDAIAGLDWPRDRLEIQVLDDSTDETVPIIRQRVEHWQGRGLDIHHIRRSQRTHYKAGALAAGLERAGGEYIAIFDADFRPQPHFLLRALASFDDPSVGFVQARWGHTNRKESLLTRIEAVLLDVPFLVGQPARAAAGYWLRFNGSAGVWRRACIEQAGGWSGDTLAEDLDLCFRAQLAGWRARYDADLIADAELPRTLEDFRRQQVRWVRGTAQVVRKLGAALLTARIPLLVKAHAWLDLLTVIAVLPVLMTALLSVPMAWLLHRNGGGYPGPDLNTSFALLPIIVWFVSVLVVTFRQQHVWWKRLLAAPGVFIPLLATILGLTWSLGGAALSGLWRRGGEFVRTPKFGASTSGPARSGQPVRAGEFAMLAYFAFGLFLDARLAADEFVPLHVALVTGYLVVLLPSLRAGSLLPGTRGVGTGRRSAARVSASVLAGLLCSAVIAPRAAAQTSLVPAQHPVYEWLHRQRVLGRADRYAYATLPLSRDAIAQHLGALSTRQDLGRTDRLLLETYLREFSAAGLAASADENLLRGEGSIRERVPRILRAYGEPHIFAATEDGYAFALDLTQSFEHAALDDAGMDRTAWLVSRGVRAFADFYGHFGLHFEAGNIEARGDREVLALDPLYGKTFEVVRQAKNNSNYIEAFVSGRYRALSAHLGHGALRVGPGAGETIWLSRDASKFDWFRLDLDTRHFRYVALQGAPAADAADGLLILEGGDSVGTRIAPQRWVALHRLELLLPGNLRLGVSELIAWSARGLDLAYLNPVSPLFFSELDNHDRDNAVLGLDMTWRPLAGMEMHGAVFVDDAEREADIVVPSSGRGATRAFDIGITGSHAAGLDAGARYVRLEPFVYAHWQALNALEQRGFPYGHSLGPNADEVRVWARLWLPRRTALAVTVTRSRKGLDPVDADGNTVENVGGSFVEGRLQQAYTFLEAADVQRWQEFGIDADTEPWRGFRFSVRLSHRAMTAGERIMDRTYLDTRLRIGF